MNPTMKAPVIHRNRPMTEQEKDKARSASKTLYPQEMPCAICGNRWMQHVGEMCPIKPGYLSRLTGLPVPPETGETTFVPDAAFYNQNPDFDVV